MYRHPRDSPGDQSGTVQNDLELAVIQDYVKPIIGSRQSALPYQLCAKRIRQPKKLESLVSQVGTQIVPQARSRGAGFTPPVPDLGSEAIEV